MYFTPTIFIAQLLAAMQVLMTLDMPLSTTMALPVTSKPIESTVENLAWQAWIELPPEQKQQVKSRKVTPKSIFTLPLRVECPQGHKQVDTKCIPIVIGSNDVLIDLNALGLLVGNTQTDELYDYDDMGEEMGNPLPYGSEMPMGESEKSVEGITVEFKPPSKDEPLKFNIFQNKFNIFHEEPLEDYSSISYEGVQSSEKELNVVVTTAQPTNETSIASSNITAINDLVSEASNISENNFEIYLQHREKNSSASDSEAAESNTLTTLADDADFKIEAISLPASGFETQKPNKVSIIQNDSSIQLVTTIMDTETTTTTDDHDKPQENDLQTLLQTESFLPMLHQATATTLQDSGSSSLTTVSLQEPNESSSDALSLNVDEEEMTTLPNVMEQELEVKDKQEYTRSVTLNPLMNDDSDSDSDDNDDNDLVKDTTLEAVTNDEPLETTTPIQLDDTTVIETSSSLSTTPSTKQEELQELLLQQEQAEKDFEELQRMRKGQKDHQQHVVLKKSKVEPVEVLATTTAATTIETTTATSLQAETKTPDELISTTAETAVVTPLLTVHNENDNNDRFYYQHFAKPDSEETQRSGSVTAATPVTAAAAAATKAADMETMPLTSEIDLAEELRLINELVKGIRPATTLTTLKTMQASTTSTTTTTTTSEKPMISSTTTRKTTLPDEVQSATSTASLSESSTVATKPTPSTSQIWSKIMPLLTTTTTQTPIRSSHESFKSSTASSTLSAQEDSNDVQTKESTSSSSTRSNRNSKIIRINGFNSISTGKLVQSLPTTTTTSTTTAATTFIEDSTPSVSTTSSSSSSTASVESSTENNTYEPYWWLPVAWRLDKPTNSDKQPEAEQEVKTEEQPLLLRFWSAYHAPKSS